MMQKAYIKVIDIFMEFLLKRYFVAINGTFRVKFLGPLCVRRVTIFRNKWKYLLATGPQLFKHGKKNGGGFGVFKLFA